MNTMINIEYKGYSAPSPGLWTIPAFHCTRNSGGERPLTPRKIAMERPFESGFQVANSAKIHVLVCRIKVTAKWHGKVSSYIILQRTSAAPAYHTQF